MRIDVFGPRHIADHRAGLALGNVHHALPKRRSRRHDQIAFADVFIGLGRDGHLRARRLRLNAPLQFDQPLRFDRDEDDVIDRLGQQTRAHTPDRTRRPDDHRRAPGQISRAHLDHRLLGRFQRGRHGEAVATGNRDVGFVRHGDARIADNAGERAQAHDARSQPFGHARTRVKLLVRQALAVLHHLARRRAQREEIAFDLLACHRRLPACDARDVQRWHVSGHGFSQRVGKNLGPAKPR